MPFKGGLPETGCGAGSTLENTASIRSEIPRLLAGLDVAILLDAPCGDFNWMSRTDLSDIQYIGCDYDNEHLIKARNRVSNPLSYSPQSKTLMCLDLCKEDLPVADLMICRDFLQHLPTKMVRDVINNFLKSGISWLLATSHDNSENTEINKIGGFRRINLTVAPFNFSEPMRSLDDGPSRILGLWHRNQVKMC